MSHARDSIQDALLAALTGLPTTGAHVIDDEAYPVGDGKLPCLQVLVGDEPQIDESGGEAPTLERQLELHVRGVVKDSINIRRALNAIIAEVEIAMNAAGTLSGKVKDISAPKSIRIGRDHSLEKTVGIAEMNFIVTYYTRAGSPGTPL